VSEYNKAEWSEVKISELQKQQSQLKLLAEAVLEAHRCMAPGHHQTVCIEEQGESCSFALCQKYTECLHHNKCQCPACTVAREVVGQG
jgi:hypothetical protein